MPFSFPTSHFCFTSSHSPYVLHAVPHVLGVYFTPSPRVVVASLGSGSLTWFTVPHAGLVGSIATALARTHHILHQPCQAKHCADSTATAASFSLSFLHSVSLPLLNTLTNSPKSYRRTESQKCQEIKLFPFVSRPSVKTGWKHKQFVSFIVTNTGQ